jgi:signal transduction histidine kinase
LDPPSLILKVKDDGYGIPTAEIREGFGFVNMRARVNKLNGVLTVRTAPGQATRGSGIADDKSWDYFRVEALLTF